MKPPQRLIEHAPSEFWIPVINRGKDHKHRTTIDDVVKMGNNKVGIMHVNVEWNLCKCYASNAAKHKVDNEARGEKHSTV